MKNTMFKPVIHTALAAAVATLLTACGTPATDAPTTAAPTAALTAGWFYLRLPKERGVARQVVSSP